MKDHIDFGQLLRAYRVSAELSQRELGDKCGMLRGRIGAYEEGRAEPSLTAMIQLAKVFGFQSLDAFLQLDSRKVDPVPHQAMINRYDEASEETRQFINHILNREK